MALKKVFITVLAYPNLSKKYQEDLVCTAGFSEKKEWIRIYPVTIDFLKGLRTDKTVKSYKYSWIELDLEKRKNDFRPESYSPNDLNDLKVIGHIDTKYHWSERKKYCLHHVYENMDLLIKASKSDKKVSLATFKPTEILRFEVEKVDEDKIRKIQNQPRQLKLNLDSFWKVKPAKPLPYLFRYWFKDCIGKIRKLQIVDWEIGALYWNCLKRSGGDQQEAINEVKKKYEVQFINECDLYFFLGTTLK